VHYLVLTNLHGDGQMAFNALCAQNLHICMQRSEVSQWFVCTKFVTK